MTKLAPQSLVGLMMGIFYVSISIGDYLGGRMASVSEAIPLPKLFGTVGLAAVVLGGVLFLLNKPMKKLIGNAE
jgi:POT family proton-dependent oligopeptide transporter